MAIVEVKVPQLSESVAEATLLQWKKKVGESVSADEILIEVETDKVVLEVPAPSAGVLVELVQGDGATVAAERGHAVTVFVDVFLFEGVARARAADLADGVHRVGQLLGGDQPAGDGFHQGRQARPGH